MSPHQNAFVSLNKLNRIRRKIYEINMHNQFDRKHVMHRLLSHPLILNFSSLIPTVVVHTVRRFNHLPPTSFMERTEAITIYLYPFIYRPYLSDSSHRVFCIVSFLANGEVELLSAIGM